MAKTDKPDVEQSGDLTSWSADDVWQTVQEESPSRVIFDTIGDVFVGRYTGELHIEPENDEAFDLYTYRGADGEPYAINQSYNLKQAMDKVSPGDIVRITYIKDIPTKKKQNPMKDFRVDVRQS